MEITARIIGALFLLLWVFFLFVGYRYVRLRGSVMYSTIFQFHILPFITAAGLLISGNLWFLIILPVAWILSIFSPSFFLFLFPLIWGWVAGSGFFTDIFPNSHGWYWGGGFIGITVMYIIYSIAVMIATNDDWQY